MGDLSWDLFPESRKAFSEALFTNPGNEYRGTPLWSWNGKLEADQLLRQIDHLEAMGFGGFHMHVRVGLDTEYLGPKFMDMVQLCVGRAKEKNMKAWLYDEDRWPSGFAGGMITEKDERFRSRHLLITPWAYNDPEYPGLKGQARPNSAEARRSELGTLLARYSVKVDEEGYLVEGRRLNDCEDADNVWYVYEETNSPSEWFNGGHYVDTLNKEAMQQFIKTTHETYRQAVGDDFGKTVPAIFTDEPQFAMKNRLKTAAGKRDVFMPWTWDLAHTYEAKFGADLLETLPEIIWDMRDPSKTRYNFHDHVCDRFVEAFTDQLGNWCNANGIALTGHMMYEEKLETQTGSLGEAMRCYRRMHLPGIDMLCDAAEYSTAKQAQSVSRQYGRCGVLSEIYGVTNWTFTFEGHKGSGDWQAALGVNVRCPHLAWLTMAGEAKRDYPAAIGYQSPWYKDYVLVENHFARVNYTLSRGRAAVRVAVVHPIESFWLMYGPTETSASSAELEKQFEDLTTWLCHGLIDFDFISESLLLDRKPSSQDGQFHFGHSAYDAIVLPSLKTIRSTTLDTLEEFVSKGGNVIVAGTAPSLVDVKPSSRGADLKACHVPFSKTSILDVLKPLRDVNVVLESGAAADSLLYQMRIDGEERYVFLCNTDRTYPRQTRIDLRGGWQVTALDTLSGSQSALASETSRGWTRLQHRFEGCGSLLLRLQPRESQAQSSLLPPLEQPQWKVAEELTKCSVQLSEPNVLLLDMVRYRLDDETSWSGVEEVLRTDNLARSRLGLPLRQENLAQPYRATKTAPAHTIHLLYEFDANISDGITGVQVALEGASDTNIELDGQPVPSKTTGWWVDEAINTVALPNLTSGSHRLVLSIPFSERTNIERVYILGQFGVDLRGREATVVDLNLPQVKIGDYTHQGLPFYAGDVHYDFQVTGKNRTAIQVPRFGAPLLRVQVESGSTVISSGKIAFQPHVLDLGVLAAVKDTTYRVRITAVGNRDHAFGAVHLPDGLTRWYGPDSWRTNGDKWAYEYTLRPMGLLTAPRLLTADPELASGTWDAGSVDQDLWFH